MREGELLAHIYERSRGLGGAGGEFPHVRVGPGDDCAVVDLGGGQVLLKVDQVVEGRHFAPWPKTPVDLIARKAVARAVSDIAAMGGEPRCALAAAALPQGCTYANDLFDAMAKWAKHWGCPLVGGDISSLAPTAPGPLVLSVSIMGVPHARRGPVLRSGAKPGDVLYVTGRIGGSLDKGTGLGRHLTFEPRLREAKWLCEGMGADLHAMMDTSDGLGIDAGRLAAASGVRLEIESARVPLSAGVKDAPAGAGDGEDYELIFAASAGAKVPAALPAEASGTEVTRIGVVVNGAGAVLIDAEGRCGDASRLGWEHGRGTSE